MIYASSPLDIYTIIGYEINTASPAMKTQAYAGRISARKP